MVHRGIATLAGILAFCFMLLSHFDTNFFLMHFYQSIIYLVIILMLFYLEDQYAYMLGMMAPAIWLLGTFATGILGAGVKQIEYIFRPPYAGHRIDAITLMAVVTAVFAVLMIFFCAQRWRREFSGLGKGLHTFLVCFCILFVYYGILVAWFALLYPWS